FSTTGAKLTNKGSMVDAPFVVGMGGADLRVIVHFPADIQISTRYDEKHLWLDFDTPLIATFLDKPLADGKPLALSDQLVWRRFQAAEEGLSYEFDDRANASEHLTILIDFEKRTALSRIDAHSRPIASVAVPRIVKAMLQQDDDCSCKCIA